MDAQSRDDLEEAHKALSRDPTYQQDLPGSFEPEPPDMPNWLEAIFKFIGTIFEALSGILGVIFWVVLASIIAYILFCIGRAFYERRNQIAEMLSKKETAEEELRNVDFRPDETVAKNFLEEADQLAAAGQFGKAIRLLLQSAIGDIQNHIQKRIGIALTAREVGGLGSMPDISRQALHSIIAAVERNVFAEQSVDENDFQTARKDYERFAFGDGAT